jgi:hypothetical protein
MPSTTVHIPDQLLSRIDKAVKEKKISRNRFIIQACEEALDHMGGEWPKGFFEPLSEEEDLHLLQEATVEMEKIIFAKRKNRSRALL